MSTTWRFAQALVAALALGAAPAAAAPAMWVVKDADSTIYLFGTVHLLKPDVSWDSPRLQSAIKDSSELWLELVGADDMAVMGPLIQKYGLDLGKPLSSKLTPEQATRLKAAAEKLGLPAAGVEPFQPWFAALTLTMLPLQKAGFDPKQGVETKLSDFAKADGDPVKGLETAEQQIGFFAAMSEADQIAFLMQAVDESEKGTAKFEAAAQAWARGDTSALETDMIAEMKAEAPHLYDVLITRRNVAWAGQIGTLLQGKGTQFIAVGAGHLVGPDSVQVQLGKRGMTATRVQ
jgi:uncharacterized protein YbaP (TraB family)